MFVVGIVIALLGAVLPSLEGPMRVGPAGIGRLFLTMNGAALVTNLTIGMVLDRFGMKRPMAAAPVLVAVAVIMVRQATAYRDLLPAMVLLGIGGPSLNISTNTLVSDLYPDPGKKAAAFNRLGVFFGFGSVLLPFLLGRLAMRPALAGAAALCLAAGLYAAVLRFPAPKQARAMPLAGIPRFLGSPLVILFAMLLFFESGAEFTLGGFFSTYLVRRMSMSTSAASFMLAAYWAAILVARAVRGRMAPPANLYRTLSLCALGACVGAALAAAAPNAVTATAALAICGASLAGIYPVVLAIAGAKFASHSGTVFGLLFGVALMGGMALPWAAGQIGGAAGLRWVFVLVAAAFAAILALSRVIAARARA